MFINTKFILASSSKSRKKILKKLNLNFISTKPNCKEDHYKKKMLKHSPKKISLELSKIKAKSVSKAKKNTLVVGSDTTISLSGELMDKAKNKKEAKKNLKKLSGKTHIIYSSVCAYYNNELVWHTTGNTKVKIRKINDEEINNYVKIAGRQILDTVGCYQIEKKGPIIIEEIRGDFFNVMGFPLFDFLTFLRKTTNEKQ